MIDTSWNPPAGGWSMEPQPVIQGFTSQVIQVCYTSCWACQFDHHERDWHTWADADDIEHAARMGHPDPTKQQCGCYCQREGYWRAKRSPARKRARILARQIARTEHYIRARPLLRNGKAWR